MSRHCCLIPVPDFLGSLSADTLLKAMVAKRSLGKGIEMLQQYGAILLV